MVIIVTVLVVSFKGSHVMYGYKLTLYSIQSTLCRLVCKNNYMFHLADPMILSEDQENFNELEQQHSDAHVYTNGHCVTDAQESLSGNSTDIELEIESQLAEMSVAEMLVS